MSQSSQLRNAQSISLIQSVTPKGGSILEVSCGNGEVLLALKNNGFEVKGTNYTKHREVLCLSEIDHEIDLLKGLPYNSGSFDTVVLLDVIEHLQDHDKAISELARVCKNNGHVIIKTPNIMKITSRLQLFLTGFFKQKRAFIGFDVPHEKAFSFHNYPVYLPIFLYQIKSHGLQLTKFIASGYKIKSFFYLFLFFPFILVFTLIKVLFKEKNLKTSTDSRQVIRILTSIPGLCGESWYAIIKKSIRNETQKTTLPIWSDKWEQK